MTVPEDSRVMQTRKRGNWLGFAFFKLFLQLFGLRIAYWFLHFPCMYYLLFDRAARKTARAYIVRRFPERGAMFQLRATYQLFLSQGRILIDRYCMIHRPELFTIDFRGYEAIQSIVENPSKGFVLLMSHMGNWQAILTSIQQLQRPVCLLMRPEDNPAVREALHMGLNDGMLKIVSPEGYLGGVVELMKLLAEGYLVAIMGDRSYGFNAVNVRFLGDDADMPCGAFSVAAAAECPIVALFSAKLDVHHYSIEVGQVFRPAYTSRKDRKANLQNWVQQYASLLERYTKQHPYQCFLFYDIWKRKGDESV